VGGQDREHLGLDDRDPFGEGRDLSVRLGQGIMGRVSKDDVDRCLDRPIVFHLRARLPVGVLDHPENHRGCLDLVGPDGVTTSIEKPEARRRLADDGSHRVRARDAGRVPGLAGAPV